MQLSGVLSLRLRPAEAAGGGQRSVEFGTAGLSPAADAQVR